MTYQPGDKLIEKYRIERLLGQGAFGEVYLVTHLALGVPRAIKVLRRDAPGMGSSDYQDVESRFRLEAQLGARLNSPLQHPNLLQIYDLRLADDQLMLEMEYASGGDLSWRMQQAAQSGQAYPLVEALRMGQDVAAGLAALHGIDVVHRDLKPANILFDEKGHARLADLGLAQVPHGPSLRSQLSNAMRHPGTAAYMSPEQQNSGDFLSPSSDVYALGLVLFELLSGRVYRTQRPGTTLRKLRPELPVSLDALLVRMLQDNPKERPWDGAEVADLLEEVRQQGPDGGREVAARVQAEAEERARLAAFEQERKLAEARERAAREEQARQANQQQRRHQELLLELAPGVTMEFVRVPAGEFTMGGEKYDREKPIHKVTLPDYLIGKYPVTNRQYQVFTQVGGKIPQHWVSGRIPFGKEEHPVVYVSWEDARAFCAWVSKKSGLNVRLPSEAEWEKAARGTDGREYPWGNQAPDAQRCNYNGNMKDTTSVGNYSPQGDSPLGCVDMVGNVLEWTENWYQAYPGNKVADANYGDKNRVLRGGSWGNTDYGVRAANRGRLDPTYMGDSFGFRCARGTPL
jgi:formylglycine-generating enzyme required for sulfatase activity/tRNA A-37 threonylcarbamoyl transferase component Bud32